MDRIENAVDAFLQDYFGFNIPTVQLTDVVEIIIIAFFIYQVLIHPAKAPITNVAAIRMAAAFFNFIIFLSLLHFVILLFEISNVFSSLVYRFHHTGQM